MSKVIQPGEQKSGMDSAMGMLQLYNQGAQAYQGIKSMSVGDKKSPEDEKREAMQRRMGQVGG